MRGCCAQSGSARQQISSIYMLLALHSAALDRSHAGGAAGFISGSSSTTWGVESVDLPVLYGVRAAGRTLPPAIVASDGWRLLLASSGGSWLVLVTVPRVG